MNRICNTCNIEIDGNNYLTDRTVCRNCYNKNRKKNNNNTLTQNEQPSIKKVNKKNTNTIVSSYKNHAYVVFGPRIVWKTYYMPKILEKIGNKRPILLLT